MAPLMPEPEPGTVIRVRTAAGFQFPARVERTRPGEEPGTWEVLVRYATGAGDAEEWVPCRRCRPHPGPDVF